MDGIILIDKEKGITSRDVVNEVSKKLHTKKVGHTGTLDPLATGLLVLCVNNGCKLVELLTNHDKDYIAKVKIGIQTDTYDITGNIIKEKNDFSLEKEKLERVLLSFNKEYEQTVPIYSSIKVKGKKLYEYARNNIEVELPSHLVKISNMKLLDFNNNSFTFSVTVSSGTYIRSLINDIGETLGIPMTMEELRRTRVGNYYVSDGTTVDELKIIPIIKALSLPKIDVDDILYKKVSNGVKIKNIYQEESVVFTKDNHVVAIYNDCGNNMMKSYRVFK